MKTKSNIDFEEAIEMGEYDIKYLSKYDKWKKLSRHVQFQYIRKAIENRRKNLLSQWAETSTILDFGKKPDFSNALKNIELQLKKIEDDREKLFIIYSK